MRTTRYVILSLVIWGAGGVCQAGDWALSIYGGRMTVQTWQDSLSTNAEFADVGLVVAAAAWTFARYFDDALSLEVEGQIGKYFGDQDHWEFNVPVAFRWHLFPWRRYLATSFAWGIGASYATENPEVEKAVKGGSQNWLVYWLAELTFGPPQADWAVLFRLHHRSGAFGSIAEEGGSNTLTAGLKFFF